MTKTYNSMCDSKQVATAKPQVTRHTALAGQFFRLGQLHEARKVQVPAQMMIASASESAETGGCPA